VYSIRDLADIPDENACKGAHPERLGKTRTGPHRNAQRDAGGVLEMLTMRKKSIHGNCAAAGMSIAELLVVVAIALIMAALAVPATRSAVASYQLNAAVDTATGAIQTTRYQAIMHGYPYQVDFDSTANTVKVLSEIPPAVTFSAVGSTVPISSSTVVMAVGTANAGSTGHAILQFKPNGVITIPSGQATPLSFTISYYGTTKTITVSNYGSITVQ
jgi:Tfp pilus assembly protein FimT